jgi:small subunit ribosomal protein S2
MRFVRLSFKPMVRLGVHIGHFHKTRNMNALNYLWAVRSGLDFINLKYTLMNLRLLLKFALKLQKRKSQILVVNNRFVYGPSIEKALALSFKKLKQAYISQDWPKGLLTNYKIFYSKIKRGGFVNYRGLKYFTRLPALVFVLTYKDFSSNWLAAECFGLDLVSSFLVDTNQTPYGIVYPIPANNDGIASLVWFCQMFKQSLIFGYLTSCIKVRTKLRRVTLLRLKNKL